MKKTLIVSGAPFPAENNLGKTLTALFDGFQKDELVQLYFTSNIPCYDRCNSYYQITEKQILSSFLGLIETRCGRVVVGRSSQSCAELKGRKNQFLVERKYSTLVLILRELLWKISKWKNRRLNHWIENCAPKVIFYILSNSASRANFVRKLSQKMHCPVVLYVTDDYYHDMRLRSGIFRKLFYRNLQKSIQKMENCVATVVGCSELAAKEFGKLLHTKYQTIFTPCSPECNQISIKRDNQCPIIFRYFGNLSLERWKVLRALGESIARYNGREEKAFLEIYAPQPLSEILDAITVFNGSRYMGWISGDKYWKLLAEADVTVHVESFSEETCRRTRLSVSTKIADYLGAGKCILAIGREDLASIVHLADCSYVTNRIEDIDSAVGYLCENPDKRIEFAESARKKAVQQHDLRKVSEQLRQIFMDVSLNGSRAKT